MARKDGATFANGQLAGGVQIDADRFLEAINAAKDELAGNVTEVANTTVELAMDATPYLRGNNRRSITADYTQGDGGRQKHIGEMPSATDAGGFALTKSQCGVRIYTQSGYGAWLELGTKRMPARPYIVPAFTKAVEDLKRDLEGCI